MKVVAYSKKTGWFTGELSLEKMKISKKKSINKLSEGKAEDTITIKRYIKINKLDTTEEVFYKALKVDRLYIDLKFEEKKKKNEEKEPETEEVASEAEKKWWKKLNKFCLGCLKTCKQSSMVTVIKCPSYEKVA
ncbi:MAG: hypothetical protein WC503_01220 [Candidatus Shapirobacteria bacterium]